MGEIAEMILDGTLCSCCGVFLDDGIVCNDCSTVQKNEEKKFYKKQKQNLLKYCDVCDCNYPKVNEKIHINGKKHKKNQLKKCRI